MVATPIRITPFVPALALSTVRMWRRAFEQAMGLPLTNGPDRDYQEQLAFLQSQLADHELTHVLHARSPRVLGFMAQQGQQLVHLYLDSSVQGQGIGSSLLQRARERSPEGLRLYTFLRNVGARAFYAAQGFTELGRGQASLQDNPWASSVDQLLDVQLQWLPGPD